MFFTSLSIHAYVETELSPEGRRARAMSGLTSRLILEYVEREGGRDAVDRVLQTAGLAHDEAALLDEGNWAPFDTKIALWSAAAEALHDPQVAYHAGAAFLDFAVGAGLKRTLRAMGSPELVYRNAVRANRKFNWC